MAGSDIEPVRNRRHIGRRERDDGRRLDPVRPSLVSRKIQSGIIVGHSRAELMFHAPEGEERCPERAVPSERRREVTDRSPSRPSRIGFGTEPVARLDLVGDERRATVRTWCSPRQLHASVCASMDLGTQGLHSVRRDRSRGDRVEANRVNG